MEAGRLKDESAKNNQMIRMQKQHEEMKNQSIQNMVRHQKMDAERRKDMVSYSQKYCFSNLFNSYYRNEMKKGFNSGIS